MATPTFSIGGIASGLDTNAILHQLMALERQPVVRFQQQQAALRRVDDAWGQITTKLAGVRTVADELRRPETLPAKISITSSNPDAVAVTTTGTPAAGTVSLGVVRLATAHQVAAGGSYADAGALVGDGTFTLTRPDGTVTSITTVESTTLAQLATQINRSGAGVSAQIVKVAEGSHRLVLSATQTGAANRFDVGGDLGALSSAETLQPGEDAHLRLGTLDVYRSSNTVNDLIDGVSLELRQTTATPLTITTQRDLDAAVKTVKGLVDALNGVFSTIRGLSGYDAAAKRSGPLQGDATARALADDLRRAVTDVIYSLPGDLRLGIEFDRHGVLKLDQTALRAALETDFDAVVAAFARTGVSDDPRVRHTASTDRTTAGVHDIVVSRAAQVAAATGAKYLPPTSEPKTFTITTATGQVVAVQINTTDTTAHDAVAKINAALAAARVTSVKADVDGDAIRLRETRYGSAHGFTVDGFGDPGLDGQHRGVDVEGTIGGLAATGRGRDLTGAEGDATGLRVRVESYDTGPLGAVTMTVGLAGVLDRVLRPMEGTGGLVARARDSLKAEIRRFDDRIADFEVRLELRETTLRRRFAAMESALGRMQQQGNWLAGQIAGLNAQRR